MLLSDADHANKRLPITLAHALTRRLSEVRKSGELSYLRPDGKSQVTVRYEDDRPVGVEKVLISGQVLARVRSTIDAHEAMHAKTRSRL